MPWSRMYVHVALLFMCVPAVGDAHTPAVSPLADIDVARARDALEHGDATRALRLFQHAMGRSPGAEHMTRLEFWAAEAAVEAGDAESALAYLDRVEGKLPEVRDVVWDLRARAHRSRGEWAQAASLWQKVARESRVLRERAEFGYADALYALRRFSEAGAAYRALLRSYGRSERAGWARLNLGDIALREGRVQDAADEWRSLSYRVPREDAGAVAHERLLALQASGAIEPPTVAQELDWANRLLTARSLDEAERVLDRLSMDPRAAGDLQELRYMRGILRYRQGAYAESLELFQGLVQDTRGLSRVPFEKWQARVLSATGRHSDAVAIYLDLAQRYRHHSLGPDSLYFAAWLAFDGGDFGRGRELFTQFLTTYPTSRSADEALWYLAWNTFRAGDIPAAIATLERLRLQHARSSLVQRAHYWEGRWHELVGNMASSRQHLREAVRRDPLDYYAALARVRLDELEQIEHDTRPVAGGSGPLQLAALTVLGDMVNGGPDSSDVPETPGLRWTDRTPLAEAALDWGSSRGRRAVRCLELGLHQAAAEEIARLEPVGKADRRAAAHAQAWLLHELGEHSSAFKLASRKLWVSLESASPREIRDYLELIYPRAHSESVRAAAQEFGISPLLVLSIMRQESGFNHRARSWASAEGLMQIIPSTASKIASSLDDDAFHSSMMRDPHTNVRFGAWYLTELLRKFHGNVALAVGSYNAGPQAVADWLARKRGIELDVFVEEIPYRETRHYVKRVLGNLSVYESLYRGSLSDLPEAVPFDALDNINF